jgi:hypothetical protein
MSWIAIPVWKPLKILAERGIHVTAQLTDYTDLFANTEFTYHQKCQHFSRHASCEGWMMGLDPRLDTDRKILSRLQ